MTIGTNSRQLKFQKVEVCFERFRVYLRRMRVIIEREIASLEWWRAVNNILFFFLKVFWFAGGG